MSFAVLPPDVKRIIGNLPDMTIGDIHALCRTNRAFNESVCRQNEHLKSVLREVHEKLTDNYDVIRGKTLAEIEADLKDFNSQRNILRLKRKGYEKPKVDYDRMTTAELKAAIKEHYPQATTRRTGRGTVMTKADLLKML